MPRRSKVVSLFGGAIPIRQRDNEIVSKAKEILAHAESGRLAGLLYGMVTPEGHIATGWVGKASSHSMLAAAGMLEHRVKCVAVDDD